MHKAITILLAFCILLCGCSRSVAPQETTAPKVTEMLTDIYTPAAQTIAAQHAVQMQVTSQYTLRYAGETFTKYTQQAVSYSPEQIWTSGTIQFGTYSIALTEYYQNGSLQRIIDGTGFVSEIPQEEYCAGLIPVILLQRQNYSSVTQEQTKDGILLCFTEPTGPEGWAMSAGGQWESAQGTALLDADGNLLSASYEIAYKLDSAYITFAVEAKYLQQAVDAPLLAENPTHVADIHSPLLAEQAYGWLLETQYADSRQTHKIVSQVNNLEYNKVVSVSRHDHKKQVDTLTTLIDLGRGGQESSRHQLEVFENNAYAICVDGGTWEAVASIDGPAMDSYCTNLLSENIMASRHITQAESQQQNGRLILHFTAGEALAETLCGNCCQVLFGDAAFLDRQTDHYGSYAVEFTLELDAATGIPLASGLSFHGIHHIDGVNYALESQRLQEYIYS